MHFEHLPTAGPSLDGRDQWSRTDLSAFIRQALIGLRTYGYNQSNRRVRSP